MLYCYINWVNRHLSTGCIMVNIITILTRSLTHSPLNVGISSFLIMGLLILGSANTYAKDKTYGPVRSGQTLWAIAYRTRPRGISRFKMMKVLHRYNPSAFENGNINLLKKGVTLKIPSSKKQILALLSNKDSVLPSQTTDMDDKNLTGLPEKQKIIQLQKDLISVKKELLSSRETLRSLKSQELKLKQAQQNLDLIQSENTQLKNDLKKQVALNAQLDALSAQYQAAQLEIKQLKQENTSIKQKQIDPASYQTVVVELNALKKQNSLLQREVTERRTPQNNAENTAQIKLSKTIAALNADINLLKNRIHELENIEQLKDDHISQLQSSLDRATMVIKNQAAVNKRIFDQLNALEVAQQRQSSAIALQPITMSAEEQLLFKTASTPQITPTTKEPSSFLSSLTKISPRFWLIITLSILLLVLALLWRQMFPKDNFNTPI